MKEIKSATFKTIEFWAATTIYVFVVFLLISDALRNDWHAHRELASESMVPNQYYFFASLARYTVLYVCFLLLTFFIVPRLIRKESLLLNIIYVLLVFLFLGLCFGFIDTYLKYFYTPTYIYDQRSHNSVYGKDFLYAAWLLLMFGFYSFIKYLGLYLISHSETLKERFPVLTPGGLIAFVLWMVSIFFLLVSGAPRELSLIWALISPFGILLYLYSLHTYIPAAIQKKNPFRAYVGKALLPILISFIPVYLISLIITQNEEAPIAISFFNAAVQLLITVPVSWIVFRRKMKGNEEIYSLKKELGQSHASFDFLRSQINPHFLFNALNTIYGTALQEKADRTAEGVERLSDMMRFMLQENIQEKISLNREIDYLINYISLQKLRTDPIPTIHIESSIQEEVTGIQVAPMLLIPFVENAFKHGISFREESYIRITLELRNNTIYFDVHNSKHVKPENDPEKNKSGIGLKNIRQRLQLLYPKRHELIIRETAKDFFVHLTLDVKKK